MIVYTTHSFIAAFEKDFKRYNISIADFCTKLKERNPIHIKEPIYKFKFYIHGIALRGFIVKKNETTLVPICVFLKNSREGENLILNTDMTKVINTLLGVFEKEFTKGLFRKR